jgi:ribose transport system ATP-binding protein
MVVSASAAGHAAWEPGEEELGRRFLYSNLGIDRRVELEISPGDNNRSLGDVEPLLRAEALTKSFGGVKALRGVDLSVAPGTIHGIVGANGSGKSTFVKILAGYHQADAGSVRVRGEEIDPAREHGHAGFRFVHQDLALIPELSVSENLALLGADSGSLLRATHGGRERDEAQKLLDEYGLPINAAAPLSRLSPSQRTMVAVIRALGRDPGAIDLLVLDEVTATLPPNEVAELFKSLRKLPKTGASVLLVSHHIEEILDICDRVSVFRDGEVVAELEATETDDRGLIELITGQDVQDVLVEQADSPGRRPVLAVHGVDAKGLEDLSFEVHDREIVGIASTDPFAGSRLLRLIYGLERRRGGTVALNGEEISPRRGPSEISQMGISLVANRLEGGIPDFSLRENLTLNGLDGFVRHGVLSGRAERSAVTGLIERFSIVPKNGEATFATLSGGNQQKAILAKSMRLNPVVLLLDDPTQGVDVGAKGALHDILRESATDGLSVLINSTDHEELCSLCHRVIALKNGRINGILHAGELTPANILDCCYRSAPDAAAANGREL